MINFSTLQGLRIPDGVVTQIADASGRVLWALQNNEPIILEVAKQSITSYSGETSYSDECVLLDIYPEKSNSTVNVTYGGLTKTLTFSGTNAQSVYFGTFNGVADSVATPASGTLTIEGDYSNFACGAYQSGSKTTNKNYCSCITGVINWGNITKIEPYAFYGCSTLAITELPEGITSIGAYAFYGCTSLALTSLPSGITSIGDYAFYNCNAISIEVIPEGVISIGAYAFVMDLRVDEKGFVVSSAQMYQKSITLPSTITSIGAHAFCGSNTSYEYGYLTEYVILATNPPALGDNRSLPPPVEVHVGVFSHIVPKGCGEVYKAAEIWSEYADYITEAS